MWLLKGIDVPRYIKRHVKARKDVAAEPLAGKFNLLDSAHFALFSSIILFRICDLLYLEVSTIFLISAAKWPAVRILYSFSYINIF